MMFAGDRSSIAVAKVSVNIARIELHADRPARPEWQCFLNPADFVFVEPGIANRLFAGDSALPAAQREFHALLICGGRKHLMEAERLAPFGPSQPGKGGANPGQQTHCTPVIIGCNRFYGEMKRKNFKFKSNGAILA